ncbi:CRISPR-associated helicase Cas3' [Desulfothermobacter acidiphilus]|uniref:CRISPR-associated helicase Cas3' n=1 Tax=Desulfothermobacter acidiphilus TaxID=1938353 RepID=UPI003F8A3D59
MKLFSFQERTREALLKGLSVVLQAPTGAGKTLAALSPFMESRRRPELYSFPRQCIYSVPMRVLANQFVTEYRKIAEGLGLRKGVTIQTGDRPEDPTLEGDLIFTTIDQTLSSVLGVPYALSLGRANLNAGAVIGSYLVFDEFHLYPPEGALKTTLQVLRLLRGVTPFVLMTATFSSAMLATLGELLEAEIVTVPAKELQEIPSQQGKVRRFYALSEPLRAEKVLEHHDYRTLVICNTVERAQQIYAELCQLVGTDRVILLHSRFTPEDRDKKEERVRREFGKNKDAWSQKTLILVATQVVEVGLDITCQNLHTEVAPAASILQRAGRCARFPGEQGEVFIYAAPPDKQGKPNYAPYASRSEIELCESTWRAFHARSGMVFDFPAEQKVIDEVHTPVDKCLMEEMRREEGQIWALMERALAFSDPSVRRTLIRKVDSRTLLVHDNPEELPSPFSCSGFSLWHGVLRGKLEKLEAWREAKGLDWALKYPVEIEEEEDTGTTKYRWLPVRSQEDLSTSLVFVVHPSLVAYDEELGFRFTPDGGNYRTQPVRKEREEREPFTYQLESYTEHVRAMLHLYRSELAERLEYAASQLEQKLGFPRGGIDQAVRLAIALHDLGKLDERWQAWVRAYQEAIGEPVGDKDFLAVHTHMETPEHREATKRVGFSRPSHAGEGAIAGAKIAHLVLRQEEGLRRAVITAVARHHSAQAKSFGAYRLCPQAHKVLREALEEAGFDGSFAEHCLMRAPETKLENQILRLPPDNPPGWWLAYFLIVRALRLADGKSQAE